MWRKEATVEDDNKDTEKATKEAKEVHEKRKEVEEGAGGQDAVLVLDALPVVKQRRHWPRRDACHTVKRGREHEGNGRGFT